MITKKSLFIFLLGLATSWIPSYGIIPSHASKQHIVLHFDVNRTIIAIDSIVGMGLHAMIDDILVNFTFEKWNGKDKQSYRSYIVDQIVQENPKLQKNSNALEEAVAEHLQYFAERLEQYPELLRQYEQEKAHMLATLQGAEPTIFPSFYKAIQWLEQHYPKRYTLYLRTFGQDLPLVMPIIERNSPLKFGAHGNFEETNLHLTTQDSASSAPTHYAIHDDYRYWESKNFKTEGGKPFPIDLTDTNVVSMFFDDYADDPEEPTIRPIGPNGEPENTERLLQLGNIVSVNPKEAILNENYFIEKIQAVLRHVSHDEEV